jgi:hypothetical protein
LYSKKVLLLFEGTFFPMFWLFLRFNAGIVVCYYAISVSFLDIFFGALFNAFCYVLCFFYSFLYIFRVIAEFLYIFFATFMLFFKIYLC